MLRRQHFAANKRQMLFTSQSQHYETVTKENAMISKSVIRGTAGGVMLTIICNIGSGQFLSTICLAAVGAAVSFLVSLLLKELVRRFRR